jgi:hypothetical protein
MLLAQVRRAPAPVPSAIASSRNSRLRVMRNTAILDSFAFHGRRRRRNFYRRIIGPHLGQRIYNISRLSDLRVGAGFVYGRRRAIEKLWPQGKPRLLLHWRRGFDMRSCRR